jgi:diadenosine tetraphosphate (Ap4A) HIT family hydrolase
MSECPLCQPQQEDVLWGDRRCRVILVGDVDHPGFCRVIWHKHVREMTDLTKSQRGHLLTVVYGVEQALRELLTPHKINLATLGNQVPHLHWHLFPRYADDPHRLSPVWLDLGRAEHDAAERQRLQTGPLARPATAEALRRKLGQLSQGR